MRVLAKNLGMRCRLFELEHKEKISDEDRSAVESGVAGVKSALESQDTAAMQAAVETLKQASQKLAEVMYQDAQAPPEGAPQGSPPPPANAPADEGGGAVDADFEVVDDDKK